jgi:hypothetical protein
MSKLVEQELGNPCLACGGAAHPASGMELPSGKVICGPCVRSFHDWITTHSKKGYRVGPKGKGAKYIPFPTGIVKESKPMKLDDLLNFLKEEREERISSCGKNCPCKECRVSEQVDSASEPKSDQVVIEQSAIEEKAPPGMEDTVMKLKKQYPDDPEKAYATAWSIYNRKTGK